MGSTEINVPTDLQVVLREFTKSVLRDMPTDMLAYSKDYFVERAHEKRMESYQLPGSTSKPFNELSAVLQQQIEDVFKRYDLNCDLSISIDELRELHPKGEVSADLERGVPLGGERDERARARGADVEEGIVRSEGRADVVQPHLEEQVARLLEPVRLRAKMRFGLGCDFDYQGRRRHLFQCGFEIEIEIGRIDGRSARLGFQ